MKPITPQLRGNHQKVVTKSPEVVLTFAADEVIFSKGDPGGDLLFIESGRVEIFLQTEKQSIILARMTAGEIIGVMTFLTRDARLASARATEPTVIKKISSTHVHRYIAGFPKWLNIVLKEFVGRINEMNRLYSESTLALKKARELQITPLFLATQLAQSLGVVGKGIGKSHEMDSYALADELHQKMQLVLNQPKEMIEGLIRIFVEVGLIAADVEHSSKQKAYKVSNLEKAAVFTQFVRESTLGTTRKILKAKLSNKEILVLKALGSMAIKKGNSEDKSTTLKISTLLAEMESLTGVFFEEFVLDKPAKVGLIIVKSDGPNSSVTLTPATVLRTVACVEALRRLTSEVDGFEEVTDDDISSEKAA